MIYEEYQEKHQGKIVHQRVQDSGYTFKYVAEQLNKVMKMSRNTLYTRLKKPQLSPKFLFNLGQIINHNFTIDFPQLEQNKEYQREEARMETMETKHNKELVSLQIKYYKTLEESNKLLKFLVRVVNENELYALKKKIGLFMDQHIKTP